MMDLIQIRGHSPTGGYDGHAGSSGQFDLAVVLDLYLHLLIGWAASGPRR